MNSAADFAKALCGVEANAVGVVKFGVAGDFVIAMGSGPLLNELEQGATDAAVANVFSNEAFEVRDGCGGGAFDMIATDGKFRDADDFIVKTGEGDDSVAGEELLDFQSMTRRRAFGPEGMAQFGPGGGVVGGGDEDFGIELFHCGDGKV